MSNRVVLVNEELFTEDIARLYETLDESIKVLDINKLRGGIEEKEYLGSIENLKRINDFLKDLSEKNFEDAKLSAVLFKYVKK